MRIINQRRIVSLDFDRIDIYLDDEIIFTRIDEARCILGRYASAERAREVFEDIHTSYGLTVVYYMPEK